MEKISQTMLDIVNEFNTGGDHGIILSGNNKGPIHTWKDAGNKNVTKTIVNDYTVNESVLKMGIGFNNKQYGFTVLDWDVLDEYNLKTIEYMLEVYKDQGIIAYASGKGFHMWFKTPERFVEIPKWTKRQVKITSFVGNKTIDYLPNNIINMGRRSTKTGKIEAQMDIDNFAEGDLSPEAVAIIRGCGYVSPRITWENIRNLPELPVELYPLGQTKHNMLDMEGSRNVGMTSWINKLSFYTPLIEEQEQLEIINDVKEFINSYYLDEDCLDSYELDAITVYRNENQTNEFYLTAGNKKAKKAALAAGTTYDQQYNVNFGEIANIKQTDLNDIVAWVMDNLTVKLYDELILFKEYDRWHTNPNIIKNRINTLKVADHLSTAQLNEIYKKLIMEMQDRIASGDRSWVADLNKRPLWVDIKGRQIDPYDVVDETGQLKIQTGLEDGIILHNMNINFDEIKRLLQNGTAGYEEELDQYHRFVRKPLMEDQARINHFLAHAGYTLMSGAKFTKKILMIYSDRPDSGKSKVSMMLGHFFDENQRSESKMSFIANNRFGLESIANTAINVGDDIDGDSKTGTEILKTAASEMFMLADMKGVTATRVLVPKMIFSMNRLPNVKHSDKGWIKRMEIVEWSVNYDKPDFTLEQKIIKEKLRNVVFINILGRYLNIGDKDFWDNPNREIMEQYESELVGLQEEILKKVVIANPASIHGKSMSSILEIVETSNTLFKANKMNSREFGRYMRELGYESVRKNTGMIWNKVA